MERKKTFEFTEEEIHVLTEALAMYSGYQREMVLPMLMGDESDLEKVTSEASTANSLFHRFFEIDRDESWEEACAQFQEIHDRPMDINDVSKYDWFEHQH